MKYLNTVRGRFIDRPNRFIARAEIGGVVETVHVKNTGRLRELLTAGAEVTLTVSDDPKRKTKFDLISVFKDGTGWINIDSQAPNALVKEWLEAGDGPFDGITLLKPEFRYGDSRVDFYLERGKERVLIEVKGCTLRIGGIGYFPDAPTERGVKHLRELTRAAAEGYRCCIAFVITMPGVEKVLPNGKTHPEFAAALSEAEKAGVNILYLPCDVRPDEINIICQRRCLCTN